jgi:hypothetical protein
VLEFLAMELYYRKMETARSFYLFPMYNMPYETAVHCIKCQSPLDMNHYHGGTSEMDDANTRK